MKWEQILCAERTRRSGSRPGRKKTKTDLRSEFEKDYHRIIGSASFRRLQDKTQVFPLDKSDFIRTRLTHSLEVSSFCKSLGQNIGENILTYKKDSDFTPRMKEDMCSILQCAGLIHDIGNPPFGHFGETAIREWFARNLSDLCYKGRPIEEMLSPQMRQDFYHFEGNAQALRLVTKLHFLVDEQGMNLTYGLLSAIIKYPVSSLGIHPDSGDIKNKKMGYYYADKEIFDAVQEATGTHGCRNPLTYILEASDDIAYKTADIEDAFVKGFLSYEVLYRELKKLDLVKQGDLQFDAAGLLQEFYARACSKKIENPAEYAVKNWIVRAQGFLISCATFGFTYHYDTIMEGNYREDLFAGTFGEQLMDLLGDIAFRYVFSSKSIYRMELTEAVMIDFLMDHFVKTIISYDSDEEQASIDKRMVAFISSNYKNAYHYHAKGKSEAERLYLRLLLVTDYVCGMTDSYAKRLYQELEGIL